MKIKDLKQLLKDIFLKEKIVGFNPDGFILKSGKQSFWYANCRSLAASHSLLDEVATITSEFIKGTVKEEFDCVLGIPEGGTILGLKVQEISVKENYLKDKIYQLRTKEKEHGDPKNKFWVNGNIPKKVVLLEDVTTTGGSVLEVAEKLQNSEIEVIAIISLFDRLSKDENECVASKMEKLNIPYFSILNAKDILQDVVNILPENLKASAIEKINKEFDEEYDGESPILLE